MTGSLWQRFIQSTSFPKSILSLFSLYIAQLALLSPPGSLIYSIFCLDCGFSLPFSLLPLWFECKHFPPFFVGLVLSFLLKPPFLRVH